MGKRSRMEYESGVIALNMSNNNGDSAERDGDDPRGRNHSWVVNSGGRYRYFCPVEGCPHGNVTHAKGWATLQSLKTHLKEHTAGRLHGAVPQAFLDTHNLSSCSICGKIISRLRNNGSCPSCAPSCRAATSNDCRASYHQ